MRQGIIVRHWNSVVDFKVLKGGALHMLPFYMKFSIIS